MRRLRVIAALVMLGIAAIAVITLRPKATSSKALLPSVETVEVKLATFDVTLRVSGALDAAKTEPIINCMSDPNTGQTQIVWLAPDGILVKPGDTIARMNVANAKKALTELEKQNANADQQERSQIDENKRRVQTAATALEKAKDNLKLVQLQSKAALEKSDADITFNQKELEVAQGQHDRYKRLVDERLMPLAKLETNADEVRRKKFDLEKAQNDLERARKDAEINEQIKQLEVHKAELEWESAKIEQVQSEAQISRSRLIRQIKQADAQRQVEAAEIKVKSAGMLLLENTWDMGMRKLRVGDQVSEGQKIGDVIDPSKMLVECDISEADIGLIKVGQKGTVRIPAIGNKVLHGAVQSIDNLSRQKRFWEGGTPGRHMFKVVLTLINRDKRLRPGMSGTVEIAIAQAKEELSVPVQSIFEKNGKQFVYLQREEHFEEVPVKVIKRSEMLTAITGKLQKGDRVASQRPPVNLITGTKGQAK